MLEHIGHAYLKPGMLSRSRLTQTQFEQLIGRELISRLNRSGKNNSLRPNSVQGKLIDLLVLQNNNFVFDDSGEAADLV
jgi:hypothetical protein